MGKLAYAITVIPFQHSSDTSLGSQTLLNLYRYPCYRKLPQKLYISRYVPHNVFGLSHDTMTKMV